MISFLIITHLKGVNAKKWIDFMLSKFGTVYFSCIRERSLIMCVKAGLTQEEEVVKVRQCYLKMCVFMDEADEN